MGVPTKNVVTTQAFQDGKGNVVALGFIRLTLSQVAEVTSGGGQVTTQPIIIALTSAGKIANTAIWFNDELTPSGTTYHVELIGSNGFLLINDFGYASIAGASFDLSTAVFSSAPPGPTFSGAVLLTPSGSQIITVGDLSLTAGGLSASTTLSIGSPKFYVDGTGNTVTAASSTPIGWSSSAFANAAADVALSRTAAGVIAVGTGAAASTAGEIDARTIGVTGSSSGKTSLVAAATASGTLTLQSATDTVVCRATTDTLSNKGFSDKITLYNNIATADYGHPAIHGTPVHQTGLTGNLAATNIYASPVTGLYIINVQCRTTTAGTGTTGTFTLTWADEGGAKSFTSGTWALNSVSITGVVTTTIPIHINSGTAVQISTTVTIGTSVYAVDAWLERVA